MQPNHTIRIAGIAMAMLALSACGSKEKASSQSIARVNGEEITVHQLNDELARAGGPEGGKKKLVLDGLIERQLLVDEAVKAKVDRDPKVMQAIERARQQIVAQAYLNGKVGSPPKPTREEIRSFYDKNPQTFVQRKQFELIELVIEPKDLSDDLIALMKRAKSLKEVQTWLDNRKIAYTPVNLSRTSVDLPPDLVKVLATMQKGRLFTIKERENVQLVELGDVQTSPVSFEAAAPRIERYLTMQKMKEASQAELARLRHSAKVELLGEAEKFAAESTPATSATPATAAVESDGAVTQTAPTATTSLPPTAVTPKAATTVPNLERGIAGLK